MPTIYRVRNWSDLFEVNRTKELKHMSWVPMPTKSDGDGYTELVDHPNGCAHLGAWTATLKVAARCEPRGTLLREGGRAHTPQTVARISRLPAEVLEEAWPRFVSIGWLEVCGESQEDAVIPQEGAVLSRDSAITGQDITGQNRTGQTTSCAESAAPPPALTGLPLYENDQKLCRRWSELVPAWEKANPGVDVLAEVRKAHAWEVSNPSKRKRDRARFLGAWIARAQDRGRPATANVQGRPSFDGFPDWIKQGPIIGPDGTVIRDPEKIAAAEKAAAEATRTAGRV